MTTYGRKPMSLIERKKQQWAREKEELAGLCGPWGFIKEIDEPSARKGYMTKTENNSSIQKDSLTTPRRSSLPPLYKNQYNCNERYEKEKDLGGETSGYGSDNPNAPEYPQTANTWHQSGYESSSSYRDDRLKWGDKRPSVGKYWESRENLNFAKMVTSEPPGWVKRGLESDTEIVVANSSPAESPQQDYGEPERPYTSSSNCQNRSYIRGQNVPLDQRELLERERRRQIALAHQEEIRKQLEEREQRRREERERRIKEEQEEELRIEREQEIERKRKEHEHKLIQEKQERERKRKEAIQEALEIAEREAKLQKMKQKMIKQSNNSNINFTECIVEKEKVPPDPESTLKIISNKDEQNLEFSSNKINNNDKKSNLDQQNNNFMVNVTNEKNSNVSNQNFQNNAQKVVSPRLELPQNELADGSRTGEDANSLLGREHVNNTRLMTPQPTPRTENVALLLQPNLESFQSMQYAVLVPTIHPTTHAAIPIAVPIAITTDKTINSPRTENRILTPTIYRNGQKMLCDSSTQTDYIDFGRSETSDFNRDSRFIRDKMNNLEIGYETRSRKGRSRNEERRDITEERPKWGANRPPTRYMKQSEKDPLYQRRKLRQKMRENKTYDDKNSSDESQTGTPRSYRKKSYVEKRHTRALWRKSDHLFGRNIKMYHTEIIPLESDKDQIYYRKRCERECCCHCRCSKKKHDVNRVDILKIEHTPPREKELIRYDGELQRNECLQEFNSVNTTENNSELPSLQDDLESKQDHWEDPSRIFSASTSNRCNENF